MVNTGITHFDSSIQKTVEWLKDVQNELGWKDEERVYIATKAVLQTLRDRLTRNEVADLGAQLPMLMRGFYYEGYNPAQVPEKYDERKKFFEKVQSRSQNKPLDSEEVSKAVIKMLNKNVSAGQIEDIRRLLPEDLKSLWRAAVKP